MTTEVLRNMIYAEDNVGGGEHRGRRADPQLDQLGYVVMDEVHYLADRFRGAVWEEVIIHLPAHVTLVSLSATVSNAEEFGDWLVTVRGHTRVVVSEVRPIPLWQHMLVGGRVFDLFALRPAAHAGEWDPTPRGLSTRERGRAVVDPELVRSVHEQERRFDSWQGGGGGARGGFSHKPRYRPPSRPDIVERLDRAGLLPAITFIFSRHGCDAAVHQCLATGLRLTDEVELVRSVHEQERRFDSWQGGGGGARGGFSHKPRYRPPSRPDIVERLDRAGLLPAITFIFSRNGCDAAVHQCLATGLRLTDEVERAEIAEIIDRRTGSLPEEDLHVLGFWEWREALLAGLAAHHAGLVPAFKETVEECFVRGLVKAVFATETLALGINMPARTVVLERLVKWNGEAHRSEENTSELQSRQYIVC